MIKILHSEPFQPLGPAIPKPAPAAPKAREIKPGIWQAPDGKLRTRNDAIDEAVNGAIAKPLPTPLPLHTPTETPLPVVPNALGDGWVEHDGVTPPADLSLRYDLVYLMNGEQRSYEGQSVYPSIFVTRDGWEILRYRISVPQ